jgi:hypothetical protein
MNGYFFLGLLTVFLSSLTHSVSAAVTSAVTSAVISHTSAKQYERVDINIVLRAEWRDPYVVADVAVDVELITPSGKLLTLPAFYISGESKKKSHWQARFTPREIGSYSYKILLHDDGRLKKALNPSQFSVNAGGGKGFLHPNNNWSLKFDNGEVFRGIGENFCWEHRDQDDSKFFKALDEDHRFNYEEMLAKLSNNGANFIRTWMIYWNLPVDWQWVQNSSRYTLSKSRFNESGIARMDQLVSIAEKNKIYIMLTLESHVGFMGSGWDNSIYNKENGGFASTPEEFFTSLEAKAQYKNKLRFMVARWGYSPSIGMWEFFNEIDNVMYQSKDARIPDALVTQWHTEMSDYLASIDPYDHLITTSISHRDVAGLNDIKTIDINQKHIYKAVDVIPAVINDYTQKHQKPYIIGEAGYEWDWSKNFEDFSAGMISDYKRELWYGLFTPTPVLPLSWWWEYFDEKGLTSYFQRLNEINNLMLQAGKGDYAPIVLSTDNKDTKIFCVKAGGKYFIYLFNSSAKLTSLKIKFEKPFLKEIYQTQAYSPETGKYSRFNDITINKGFEISLEPHEDKILVLQ